MRHFDKDQHETGKRQAMRWAETGTPPPRAAHAMSERDAVEAMPAQQDDISTGDAPLAHGSDGPGLRPSGLALALAPGSSIGQYEIIRLLGRGGMGEVHLARDLRLGRLVAVKLLTAQRPNLGERFLAEARATARCHHENIVVIHEVGEISERGGPPYMVLEYLEGQTLRQWLREHAAAAGQHAQVPPSRASCIVT
jgi:serine/threonine protein kinase